MFQTSSRDGFTMLPSNTYAIFEILCGIINVSIPEQGFSNFEIHAWLRVMLENIHCGSLRRMNMFEIRRKLSFEPTCTVG